MKDRTDTFPSCVYIIWSWSWSCLQQDQATSILISNQDQYFQRLVSRPRPRLQLQSLRSRPRLLQNKLGWSWFSRPWSRGNKTGLIPIMILTSKSRGDPLMKDQHIFFLSMFNIEIHLFFSCQCAKERIQSQALDESFSFVPVHWQIKNFLLNFQFQDGINIEFILLLFQVISLVEHRFGLTFCYISCNKIKKYIIVTSNKFRFS